MSGSSGVTEERGRMSFWVRVGPVCAATPTVVHGADGLQRIGKKRKRKTVDTYCGKRAVLVGIETVTEAGVLNGHITAAWPPYVEECREMGRERCAECFAREPGKPQKMVPTPYKPKRKRVSS